MNSKELDKIKDQCIKMVKLLPLGDKHTIVQYIVNLKYIDEGIKTKQTKDGYYVNLDTVPEKYISTIFNMIKNKIK